MSDVFTRNNDYVWRIIEGEAILMPPGGGQLHAFNDVATRIWELLDGSKSVSDVIDQIYDEYEVQKSTAQKDVVSFIEKLLSMDALILKS